MRGCDHYVETKGRGGLVCRNCGSEYVIGLDGCYWRPPAPKNPPGRPRKGSTGNAL